MKNLRLFWNIHNGKIFQKRQNMTGLKDVKIIRFMHCHGKFTRSLCSYGRDMTSDWLAWGLSVSVLLHSFVRVCLCVYCSIPQLQHLQKDLSLHSGASLTCVIQPFPHAASCTAKKPPHIWEEPHGMLQIFKLILTQHYSICKFYLCLFIFFVCLFF